MSQIFHSIESSLRALPLDTATLVIAIVLAIWLLPISYILSRIGQRVAIKERRKRSRIYLVRKHASRKGQKKTRAAYSRIIPQVYLEQERFYKTRNLLNASERAFFHMLEEAVAGRCYIFSQVSFNALLTHSPWMRSKQWIFAVRRQFNTKFTDFVLCDKNELKVLAIVEYDGAGHRSNNDRKRDALLRHAGYKVERFTPGVTANILHQRLSGYFLESPQPPLYHI